MTGSPNPTERIVQIRFREQEGRCHWCGVEMIPPGTYTPRRGIPMPDNLCTRDHLRDQLADVLREEIQRHEAVAACYRCNTARGLVRGSLVKFATIRTRVRVGSKA